MRYLCILCCVLALAVIAGCVGSDGGASAHYGAGGSMPGNCCGN